MVKVANAANDLVEAGWKNAPRRSEPYEVFFDKFHRQLWCIAQDMLWQDASDAQRKDCTRIAKENRLFKQGRALPMGSFFGGEVYDISSLARAGEEAASDDDVPDLE